MGEIKGMHEEKGEEEDEEEEGEMERVITGRGDRARAR